MKKRKVNKRLKVEEKIINMFRHNIKSKRSKAIIFSTIFSLLITSLPMKVYAMTDQELPFQIEFTEDEEVITNLTQELNDVHSEIEKQLEEERLEEERKIYEEQRLANLDNMVIEYANYFGFDESFTLEAVKFITNDYNENMDMFGNLDEEGFVMSFMYNLSSGKLEDYGYSSKDFKTEETQITNIINEDGRVLLSNGLSYDEFLYVVCDKLSIDPDLVMAISSYETGFLKSDQAMNKNNFGGLKGSKSYLKFNSPQAGIIYLCFTVKRILDNDSVDDINELSGVYVNGSISKPSSGWVNGVKSIYRDLTEGKTLELKK